MSKTQKELLMKRAVTHASAGFNHLLDFEAGRPESITEAIVEASSIPRALAKLGLDASFGEGSALSVDKIQNMQQGLQNNHQKSSFVLNFKSELTQYSHELWTYFENTCLAVEGASS